MKKSIYLVIAFWCIQTCAMNEMGSLQIKLHHGSQSEVVNTPFMVEKSSNFFNRPLQFRSEDYPLDQQKEALRQLIEFALPINLCTKCLTDISYNHPEVRFKNARYISNGQRRTEDRDSTNFEVFVPTNDSDVHLEIDCSGLPEREYSDHSFSIATLNYAASIIWGKKTMQQAVSSLMNYKLRTGYYELERLYPAEAADPMKFLSNGYFQQPEHILRVSPKYLKTHKDYFKKCCDQAIDTMANEIAMEIAQLDHRTEKNLENKIKENSEEKKGKKYRALMVLLDRLHECEKEPESTQFKKCEKRPKVTLCDYFARTLKESCQIM